MRVLVVFILVLALLGCDKKVSKIENKGQDKTIKSIAQGNIINGLRVYTIKDISTGKLAAFRGDYVKIEIDSSNSNMFSIDSLKISHSFPIDESGKAYFKLKTTGKFNYKFGKIEGEIEITEYTQPNYKAVSAEEGAKIIENISPLILDVRTEGEFNAGHLENAMLIPVQIIQKDYIKIEDHKDKPIFIYCASGNRSTVASRVLIEKGFTNIYNLRPGIAGWHRAGLKIVK